FSCCSPSPIASDFACEALERGDLRRREVSPLSLAENGHEVHGYVRPEICRHDPITSAFSLAPAGKADLANAPGGPNFISLPGIGGYCVNDRLMFSVAHSHRLHVAEELR